MNSCAARATETAHTAHTARPQAWRESWHPFGTHDVNSGRPRLMLNPWSRSNLSTTVSSQGSPPARRPGGPVSHPTRFAIDRQ